MTPLDLFDLVKISAKIGSAYPKLNAAPKLSAKKLRDLQWRELKARYDEAADVTLYRQLGFYDFQPRSLDDWAKLPLVRKSDLLARPLESRLHPSFKLDDLIVSKSSGSTGQALDVYYDRESFYLFVLAGLRLYRMAFNYSPWHKQTYIYTSAYPFSSLFGLYPMNFISTLNPVADTIVQLRKNPPDLLVCYPSHLRAIVDQMAPADFDRIRPLAVNVNSEMSTQTERDYLARKLGTFVFDDYSSEELTRIASQCRHLSYHIFEDINYIEIVDDDGRPVPEGVIGNIVGSNLHNRAMPLLRYMQGDRGAVRMRRCECGSNFRILEKLEGRKNDAFVLPDGATLSSGYLLDLTYGVILNHEQAVRGFCLVQDRADLWELEVMPGSGWGLGLADQLRSELEAHLHAFNVRIAVKVVEQVSRTKSGKSNPIISRIKKE